jgi:hypothetical protein
MATPKINVTVQIGLEDYQRLSDRVEELGVTRAAFIRAAIASALEGGAVQSVEKRSRPMAYDDDPGAAMPYPGPGV